MATTHPDHLILRELGRHYAEAAARPEQGRRAELWRRLNRLDAERPLVLVNQGQVPWPEFGAEITAALAPRCADPFLRSVEQGLRLTLHQLLHFPGDLAVEPNLVCDRVWHDTGFGFRMTYGSNTHSTAFPGEIDSVADIERIIQMPVVTAEPEETARCRSLLEEVFVGILPVVERGITHVWFAPWDVLIQPYGINQLFTDMIDRPELVRAAIGRMMDAYLCRLEQWERLGLLSLGPNYHGVGSGGLGLTDQLPSMAEAGSAARTQDQWGTSTGQIFGGASPAMHEEFCLRHELRWLERFGLNCYGCCEALHHKMGMLKRIPRLRRISVSPWADVAKAAAGIGTDYVFSLKPNPALLATETWDLAAARAQLRADLDRARGCRVEVILKDVSTVRGEPWRLTEWTAMAMAEAERFADRGLAPARSAAGRESPVAESSLRK